MRTFIAVFVVVIAAFMSVRPALAEDRNPWELRNNGSHPGMVIIAINDGDPDWKGPGPFPLDFDLKVAWFDPVKKTPHVEFHWVNNPTWTDFKLVTDDEGNRYLVGQIGEGESLIARYSVNDYWDACFNGQTYHFYIKRGTYNFIGRLDDRPTRAALNEAISSGRMQLGENHYVPPLVNQRVGSLAPLDGDLARVQKMAAKALGHPVEIVTPELHETTYNLAKNPFGQQLCGWWAGSGDRPDRTTPAPADAPVDRAAMDVPPAVPDDKNPFKVKPDKFNRGTVIVAIDDAPEDWDPATSKLDFQLEVDWFDRVKKKPHVELHLTGNTPFTALFTPVTDAQGHRYLVGSIGEGEALIVSYYARFSWGMCYNAETYHFYVKRGTYNFIGRFDDKPSFDVIDHYIKDGVMPAEMAPNARTRPIIGRRLEGFTTGDVLPDDKARVEALAARWLGHPVDILTPVMTKTDYNVSSNPLGDTECAYWSGGGDRPDQSQPMAPEPPVADSAAKPAAAVTWIPRQP